MERRGRFGSGMCNDFGNHIPYSDYLAAFSQTRILRSEGRRFPVGRCLIPASHFFEFTETKSPKTKWKFTKAGEDWFCFAGLWRPMADARWPGGLHPADDGTRLRCRADSRSPDGRPESIGMVGMASADRERGCPASSAAGG